MKYLNSDGGLEMMLRMAAENMPLTEAEFHCFCDANNGTCFTPADIEQSFSMNVADSGPDGLGEKWGVDLLALARKLEAFPTLQKIALLGAMDGFFKRSQI